jgi:predicted AAA+ superfamily ATPase
MNNYLRHRLYDDLWNSLRGRINLIQAVIGPRQVGKTTMALQILEKWPGPKIYETADQPDIPNLEWINIQWNKIRNLSGLKKKPALLVLDEIQKIQKWSDIVKKLFDEDRRLKNNIRVLILGSSALLMQRGLSESLTGRFELQRHNQWSFAECREYFSLSLDEYLYFGGYPGALRMRRDENRWARYMRDSLIETVLSKDIILLSPITKPFLLRQSFGLAVNNAARIISYQKMLGSLQDAGNTTTIASYLHLLSKAFLLTPLERWSGSRIRQRGSIPKILVFDNGLVSSMSGLSFRDVRKDKALKGRLIENAVGAMLYFITDKLGGELYYWRERDKEVDYVVKIGNKATAFEVKSGIPEKEPAALTFFVRKYKNARPYIISNSPDAHIGSIKNINLEEAFKNPEKLSHAII